MTEPTTTPDGISLRDRINISRTSTGKYSFEMTCEITRVVGLDEVLSVAADKQGPDRDLIRDYRANVLRELAATIAAEIDTQRTEGVTFE